MFVNRSVPAVIALASLLLLGACTTAQPDSEGAGAEAPAGETAAAANPTTTAASPAAEGSQAPAFAEDLCPLIPDETLTSVFGEAVTTEHIIGISCQYTTAGGGSASLNVQEGTEGTFNEVSYGSRSVLADQTPRELSGFTGQAVLFASTATGTEMPVAVAIVEFPAYVVSTDVSVAGTVEDQARIAEALLRAGLDAGLG